MYSKTNLIDCTNSDDSDEDNSRENSEKAPENEPIVGETGMSLCDCCCTKTDKLRGMWEEHCSGDKAEVYGAMLVECFALPWTKPDDGEASAQVICEACVARLKDAVSFKAEVLTAAARLDTARMVKQETVECGVVDVQLEYFNMECDADDAGSGGSGGSGEPGGGEGRTHDPIMVTVKLEPISTPEDIPSWSPVPQGGEGSARSEGAGKRSTRRSEAIPKRYKQYTPADVQRAVRAVVAGSTSQNAASKTFKVPARVLAAALKSHKQQKPEQGAGGTGETAARGGQGTREVARGGRGGRERKKQLYSEQALQRAVDEVWSKRMTQTEASRAFNVPRSTIFDMINKNLGKPRSVRRKADDGPQEMAKHASNIATIMASSNATPIRRHGDGGYRCCFCTLQYPKPEDLKTHTLTAHDLKTRKTITKGKRPSSYFVKLDISYLNCTVCDSNIDTLEELIDHLVKEHQLNMYTDIKNHILPFKFETDELKCMVCGNVYNKFKRLQEHLNVHYQNYMCDVCNTGFVSRMILHNHTRGHKVGVFTCEVCSKVYTTLRKLTYHKNLVHRHSYMVSKCGYCHQKFKSYQRKLEHLTRVHNVNPMQYACRACHRTFASQAGLRVHKKRDHLMERRYKCDDCDMEFFARAELNAHTLKHTGVRQFTCDVCQKSFKRKFTLTEHMRIHDNNCRFKCELCAAAFVQKCSWRGHMRNKHGVIS